MISQSYESRGDFWPVMKWAGITMVVMSAGLYLDVKGLIPKWIENLPPWAWFFVMLMLLLGAIFVEKLTFEDVKLFFNGRSRE